MSPVHPPLMWPRCRIKDAPAPTQIQKRGFSSVQGSVATSEGIKAASLVFFFWESWVLAKILYISWTDFEDSVFSFILGSVGRDLRTAWEIKQWRCILQVCNFLGAFQERKMSSWRKWSQSYESEFTLLC